MGFTPSMLWELSSVPLCFFLESIIPSFKRILVYQLFDVTFEKQNSLKEKYLGKLPGVQVGYIMINNLNKKSAFFFSYVPIVKKFNLFFF